MTFCESVYWRKNTPRIKELPSWAVKQDKRRQPGKGREEDPLRGGRDDDF
ncbi:hypothetical protein [Streptomyces virginiae]